MKRLFYGSMPLQTSISFSESLILLLRGTIGYHAIDADSKTRDLETQISTEPFTLAGKSMYFIVLDRFARSGAQAEDYTYCSKSADWTNNTGGGYCGGTIAGILSKLDYIQGMGFDCIWITPPVDSNGYMGYDAINLFKINPHFGTREDLKQLSKSLHDRGMCLVLDIVLNHMRSLKVNGKLNISSIVPFNKPEYYHQRGRRPDQAFEEYLLNGPPPAFDGSTDSKNLAALVKKRKEGHLVLQLVVSLLQDVHILAQFVQVDLLKIQLAGYPLLPVKIHVTEP
ncbi:amy [Symbiodinium sp. CCMP2592]|nr:amy [Symbiodinium sp. CCMP2592]